MRAAVGGDGRTQAEASTRAGLPVSDKNQVLPSLAHCGNGYDFIPFFLIKICYDVV